jgi:hypothetical protein
MNPFEQHGIAHLSASSINSFCTSPALWVMERLLKRSAPVGAAAHRGTSAEDGIVAGLLDRSKTDDECAEIALAKFRTVTALCKDPNREKELAALPGIVKCGLAELRPYGVPDKTQGKIEITLPGLMVPVIGYYDLFYEGHGIIIDIKTQLRLASSIKVGHARQVSLYKVGLGDNLDARLTYVTDKKAATYTLENHRQHVEAVTRIALTMQRFLALSADADELAGLVAPDTDHFFFSDPIARQHAFEVWGI